MQDALHERGHAMESAFFRGVDADLIAKMKAELQSGEDRAALLAATGIDSEEVIDQLIKQGISAQTLASVGLIPLVAVAWADGKMEDNERQAVLKAAAETGIKEGQGSYDLVSNWLANKPEADLLQSWKDYITAMKASLDASAVSQVKNSVVGRAKKVAQAAGGFLGIMTTSDVEQKVLDELTEIFG